MYYHGTSTEPELTSAITKAIKYCEKNEILQPFLKNHASEVQNMLYTEFNIDTAKKIWQEEAREDALEEGRIEGMSHVLSLLEEGKSLDEVKNLLGDITKPQ